VNRLIAIAFWIFAIWLIRRDTKSRDGISGATWIPTLWAAILTSRPLSMWLGVGGGIDTLEGSPLDRLFFMVMIGASLFVLSRRQIDWGFFISQNWPIFLFYGFFLISVSWADSPVSSFKRWFKDLGNVFVALVILTEKNPAQAFRAVFVRCAYLWMPLSVIFIRYFPSLGRHYLRGGALEPVGVTTQKNSLGVMVLVCGIVLLWDWFERQAATRLPGAAKQGKFDRYLPLIMFGLGAYLLHLCDSATSIVCLGLAAAVLSTVRFPLMRRRIGSIGGYALAALVLFFFLDWAFGIKEAVVGSLGRDMTFTGRTDVWRVLLDLKTDPIIGTGFCSFWSDQRYLSQLPDWIAFSAHNGYIETYIDGGWIGIFFLTIFLLVTAFRINAQLSFGNNVALIRFAVLIVTLVGNFSESHFGRMGPLWFMFLLSAIDPRSIPEPVMSEAHVSEDVSRDDAGNPLWPHTTAQIL